MSSNQKRVSPGLSHFAAAFAVAAASMAFSSPAVAVAAGVTADTVLVTHPGRVVANTVVANTVVASTVVANTIPQGAPVASDNDTIARGGHSSAVVSGAGTAVQPGRASLGFGSSAGPSRTLADAANPASMTTADVDAFYSVAGGRGPSAVSLVHGAVDTALQEIHFNDNPVAGDGSIILDGFTEFAVYGDDAGAGGSSLEVARASGWAPQPVRPALPLLGGAVSC